MDRLFIISRDAVEDKTDRDFLILYDELKQTATRNLDYVIMDDEELPKYITDSPQYHIRITVPVGGIDYVRSFLEKEHARDAGMTPLEIPEYLRKFARRDYRIMKGADIIGTPLADASKWFTKDISELKTWNSLLYDGDISRMINPERMYSISEKVDILSEYRVFVYMDEVQAVQHYIGNPLVFPNANTIKQLVDTTRVNSRPDAYTLDVAIIQNKDGRTATVPLEMHPFVSCGLYGFMPDRIGAMLEAGYKWYL